MLVFSYWWYGQNANILNISFKKMIIWIHDKKIEDERILYMIIDYFLKNTKLIKKDPLQSNVNLKLLEFELYWEPTCATSCWTC